jgi:hypothetical protein
MALFDKEASQRAIVVARRTRATSRGSPRSFAAQKKLAQDDKSS